MSLPALTLPATVPSLTGLLKDAETFKSDAECFEVIHAAVVNTKGNPKFNG